MKSGLLTTIFSSIFRVVVFAYLRVVPTFELAKFAVPTVLVAFYASFLHPWVPKTRTEPTIEPAYTDIKQEEPVGPNDAKDEVKQPLVVQPNAASPSIAIPAQSPTPIQAIRTVLFSLPTKSTSLNLASIAINTLLFAFCLDFALTSSFKTYDPTFTRVGALDSSSAKIQVRYPNLEENQLRVIYRQATPTLGFLEGSWKDGPVLDIEEEKDFTAVGKLTRLWPSSKYEYRFAYLNGTLLPYPENPITFKTFPDPRMSSGVHFRFLASSCILPNFPYSPLGHERIKGWDLLADNIWPPSSFVVEAAKNVTSVAADAYQSASSAAVDKGSSASSAISSASTLAASSLSSAASTASSILSSASSAASSVVSSASSKIFANAASAVTQITPEFMLFLGDFIYADQPKWGGDRLEYYRKLYKRVYASPSFRKVYERLPIFSIWDDHEFVNNWAGKGKDTTIPFRNASSAFDTYNAQVNPDPVHSDEYYFEFRYGDNAFFVMDTRRYRTESDVVDHTTSIFNTDTGSSEETKSASDEPLVKTMLGDKQLTSLYSWLGKVNNTATFKFIFSSVPFTTLWHGFDGQADSWAAFREERDAILDVLEYVPNVILVSGDRHEFAVVEFRGKVLEISVSPVSQFALPSYSMAEFSEKHIEKSITTHEIDANGTTYTVDAIEYVPEERRLKYIPNGAYKFGSFEVDTTDRTAPTLKIEAIISGQPVYELNIKGKPVSFSYTNALGHQITSGIKGILDKVGLNPLKWM